MTQDECVPPEGETDRAVAERMVEEIGGIAAFEAGLSGRQLINDIASALATARAEASARVRIVRQATLAAAREESREEIAAALERAKEYFGLLAEAREEIAELTRDNLDMGIAASQLSRWWHEDAERADKAEAALAKVRAALEHISEQRIAAEREANGDEEGDLEYALDAVIGVARAALDSGSEAP